MLFEIRHARQKAALCIYVVQQRPLVSDFCFALRTKTSALCTESYQRYHLYQEAFWEKSVQNGAQHIKNVKLYIYIYNSIFNSSRNQGIFDALFVS